MDRSPLSITNYHCGILLMDRLAFINIQRLSSLIRGFINRVHRTDGSQLRRTAAKVVGGLFYTERAGDATW